MQLTHISINDKNKETIRHGSVKFPMQVYTDDLEKYDLGFIRWHWHNEIEFAVVLQGEVECFAGEHSILLREGEGIFINSEVLHMAKSKKDKNAIMFTVVVNPILLSDGDQSIINEKYVIPLLKCPKLSYLKLNLDIDWQMQCIKLLQKIYTFLDEEAYAFELWMRNYVCEIWLLIVINTRITIQEYYTGGYNLNQTRLKQMISYIYHHYHESILLSDIAASAHISKSECYRCFQNLIGMRPFEYIMEYRLKSAAQLLLESEMSITEVALACGYNSLSYFGKQFKQHTGMTPLTYRHSTHHNKTK